MTQWMKQRTKWTGGDFITSGWHHTFGWLRRPELDEANSGFVYEMPDGTLVVSKEMRHRRGMLLDVWRDAGTGELYTACSHVPRVYCRRAA